MVTRRGFDRVQKTKQNVVYKKQVMATDGPCQFVSDRIRTQMKN